MVEYTYDAWGKPLSKTGTMANTLGALNPFRYRGYVYDEETGLYYLRSRYYNPTWGRFINADSLIGQVGGLLNHNLFAYCKNSPIDLYDANGNFALVATAFAYGLAEAFSYFAAAYFGWELGKAISIPAYNPPVTLKLVENVQTVEITKTVDIAISPTLNKTYPRSTAVHHIVVRKASQALPARRLLEAYLV